MSEPQPLHLLLQKRVADLAARPSRHATDPEPAGHVPDVDRWRDGQWRRAVPPRFRAASLDRVEPAAAEALRMWLDCTTERPNLLLFGPVGTGKTYAATAALRPLHDRGMTIAFWPVTSLLEATSPGAPHTSETMAAAIAAEVLLLDDLGMERGTEWAAERVYEVVNQRWLDQVPTVVTTNVAGPDEMAATLGERLWSRLQDGAVALRLTGQDRRRA